jgi:hypothetical protein
MFGASPAETPMLAALPDAVAAVSERGTWGLFDAARIVAAAWREMRIRNIGGLGCNWTRRSFDSRNGPSC